MSKTLGELNAALAEQYWREEFTRLGGHFPALETITDAELLTLARVRRATPDFVARRIVVAWNGRAIWFKVTKGGIRWYVLTHEQDDAVATV